MAGCSAQTARALRWRSGSRPGRPGWAPAARHLRRSCCSPPFAGVDVFAAGSGQDVLGWAPDAVRRLGDGPEPEDQLRVGAVAELCPDGLTEPAKFQRLG